MQAETIADALKVTPPAVVTVTSLAGYRWDTISYVLTSIYVALTIGKFIWVNFIKRSPPGAGDEDA